MEQFVAPLSEFIVRHQAWAGIVLGLVTFVESLVLVGAFVPATALMLLAGGLMATGVLDPFGVILSCVAGAALGDAVSYWIGRRLGPKAMRHRAFRPHRRKIARTRLFTRKYGSASIYIGRFFGPLRAFVPIAAGMLRMPTGRFQVANVLSALIWVPAMLAPGYFAAKGLAELERLWEADALTLAIVGTAIVVGAAALAWRLMVPRVRRREAVGALMQAVGLRR